MKDWTGVVNAEVSKTAETVCRFDEGISYVDKAIAEQKGYAEHLTFMKTELESLKKVYAERKLKKNSLWTGEYTDSPEQKDELMDALRFCVICGETRQRITENQIKCLRDMEAKKAYFEEMDLQRRLCRKPFRDKLTSRLTQHAKNYSSSFLLMFFTGFIFYPLVAGPRANKLLKQMQQYAGMNEIQKYSLPEKVNAYENCNFENCCNAIKEMAKKEATLMQKYSLWDEGCGNVLNQLNESFNKVITEVEAFLKPFRKGLWNAETTKLVVETLEEAAKAGLPINTLSDVYRIGQIKE
ncbi:MAG: hypothetical protein K2M64_04500 [Clostridia bacterium]|nr:hypothetical protein [Clostridia bacterium]